MPRVRRAFRTKSKFAIDAGDYGLIGDGSVHPLSQRYGSLGAAQDDYPFAISLTQQIDYCAIKLASNDCHGAELEILIDYVPVTDTVDDLHIVDSTQNWTVNQFAGQTAFRRFESNGFVTSAAIASNTSDEITLASPMPFGTITAGNSYAIGYGEHGDATEINRKLRIPGSNCWLGDDTFLIRNLRSGFIEGEGGRLVTKLRGNSIIFQTDGFWYSTIRDLEFEGLNPAAPTVVDIDGNRPGHPYATRGVQGNTFHSLLIHGARTQQVFSICRLGGSGGQGSENSLYDVHMSGGAFTCYYQNGFNALGNKIRGGNYQDYPKHAIYCVGAACDVDAAFQSTRGYEQVENDGADIRMGDAGASDAAKIGVCRTESLVFFKSAWPAVVDLSGCTQNVALIVWFAGTNYGPTSPHGKAIHFGGRLFYTDVDGTTGGTIPDFDSVPENGTIVDNTITWTERPFNFIDVATGSVNRRAIKWDVGKLAIPPETRVVSFPGQDGTEAEYRMSWYEDIVDVNATTGPKIIYPPDGGSAGIGRGRIITIKKNDLSLNSVTIPTALGGVLYDHVIPGGVRGERTLFYNDWKAGYPSEWKVIASSEALEDTPPLTYTAAHSITLADNHKTIQMNTAGAAAFTFLADTMPIGSYVEMVQIGAGLMSAAAGAGVTIEPSGALNNQGQWKAMSAYQRSLNNWVVIGGVA